MCDNNRKNKVNTVLTWLKLPTRNMWQIDQIEQFQYCLDLLINYTQYQTKIRKNKKRIKIEISFQLCSPEWQHV